jgi:casein kinase 1
MDEKRKRRKECSGEFLDMELTKQIKIVDVINAGSFGDIYLGRNATSNVEYAIKFDKNETPRT